MSNEYFMIPIRYSLIDGELTKVEVPENETIIDLTRRIAASASQLHPALQDDFVNQVYTDSARLHEVEGLPLYNGLVYSMKRNMEFFNELNNVLMDFKRRNQLPHYE